MSSGWQQRAPAHPSPVESDSSCVKQKDGCSSQALLKQEQHDLQVFTWDSIQSGSSNDLVQDNTPSSAMSEGLPPRVLLTITKLQCQLETKQQRIAALERQVEDLMQDRNFLRNQIENLTSNRTLAAYAPLTHTPGAKSSRGQHSEPRARKRERSPSSSSLSNCSDSESSGSSEAPDNSSERRRKKHPKTKKRGKNGKDFRRKRATDVRYIVQRYQKVLEAFVKKKNMTEAFQRCGVDRNTIANTASIVELHLAAPDPSLLVGPFRPGEDTLVSYAQRCTLVIDSDAQLARRIDQMKASGELLPISGKRSRGLQPHFLPLGGGVDSIVL